MRLHDDDPKVAIEALRAGLVDVEPGFRLASGTCGPWSLALSYGPRGVGWRFSAKLMTRGSTEKDWELLGRLASLVGAPDKMPETIRTDPNATHYWTWEVDDDIVAIFE